MALILTRSPFHISRGLLDANASALISIGRMNGAGNLEVVEEYTLSFRDKYFIDISKLCSSVYTPNYSYIGVWSQYITSFVGDSLKFYENGYIAVTISGEINGVAQADQVSNYFCTDGYVYSSEKTDKDFVAELENNSFYAGSSDIIYKLDDSNLRIPILNPKSYTSDSYVNVSFLSKGSVVFTDSLLYRNEGDSTFTVSRWARTFDYPSFLSRVNSEEGEYEESKCIEDFFDEHKIDDVDEVYISAGDKVKILKVKTVEECKYNPYRITFRNRYGVMEDLWFFKKSVASMSVTSEEFRANQFKQRSSGGRDRDAGLVRSVREYGKNGVESLTINSGFVDEALNESFKQLMLSEEVELYDFNNDVLSAVKISDSQLKMKTSVNDKLINYTIEVEFSNNIIDDVI